MAHNRPEVRIVYKLGDVVCETNKWKTLGWHQQIPGVQAKPHCEEKWNLREYNHIGERGKMQPRSSLAVRPRGNNTLFHIRSRGYLDCLICLTHNVTFLFMRSEPPLMQREQ